MINRIFRFYWRPVEAILALESNRISQKIQLIYGVMTVFYGFVFYRSIEAVYKGNINYLLNSLDRFSPKWPINIFSYFFSFADNITTAELIKFILFFSLLTGFLGFLFASRSKLVRVISFIGILLNVSLINSFGKGSHAFHLGLMVSLFLIFIPSVKEKSIENNRKLLSIIYTIRNFILLSYFSSGFIKIVRLIQHTIEGKMTALHKFGFANLISKDWYLTGNETLFGPFIVQNESFLWPIILMSGYFIELLAIVVLCFPKFDKIWFVAVICLHIGILLTLGPNFSEHLFVVALFIGFSVFSDLETKGDDRLPLAIK